MRCYNFYFIQSCLYSLHCQQLESRVVLEHNWPRTSSLFTGSKSLRTIFGSSVPSYRRERERKFSQAKYNRQFTYSPRTAKEADKLCWCEVAVGCSWGCSTRFCLHAHCYQHEFRPEGTSLRMNKKRGRKVSVRSRNRERIRDDESVTKEMDADLEAQTE